MGLSDALGQALLLWVSNFLFLNPNPLQFFRYLKSGFITLSDFLHAFVRVQKMGEGIES